MNPDNPPSCPPVPRFAHPERTCTRHTLVTYESDDSRRPLVEQFVQRTFADRHGAMVRSFMPTLLALQGREERVCGVVGFRNAHTGSLFLERYLARPIEFELSERMRIAVKRDEIVEVGNLASRSCRAAVHLVAALPGLLIARGNRWIVFTATSAVRGILERFQAPMVELGSARRELVGQPDEWGCYYEHDPRVMAGYLPDGLALAMRAAKATGA